MPIIITRRQLRIGGIILAVIAATLLFDWIYVSDEEKIDTVVDRLVLAVEQAKPNDLVAELTVDFLDDELTREDVLEMAKAYFQTYGPTDVMVTSRKVSITGEIANVDLSARAGLGGSAFSRTSAATQWRLGLIRVDGRWRVDRITPVSINNNDVSSLKSLGRRFGGI